MIAKVITILDLPQSVTSARRCIESAKAFGLTMEMHPATTPADNPAEVFAALGWPTGKFTNNRFSRPLPCMAAFLSHSELWAECLASNRQMIVCEHDAAMVRELPDLAHVGLVVNLGAPSFGTFKTPAAGIGPLVSKPFFPGAHAYLVTPEGAVQLLARAKTEAEATDVFLSLKRFPFLREAFPHPFVCRDDFSSIQGPLGIQGRHRPVTIL